MRLPNTEAHSTEERKSRKVRCPTNSRRFLIYAINYSPELTGAGRYTGELGEYCRSLGIPFDVITTPPHYPSWSIDRPYKNKFGYEVSGTERIFRCPILIRKNMKGIWRLLGPISFAITSLPVLLWKFAVSRPATIFLVIPSLTTCPAAILLSKLTSARVVIHVQDLEVEAAFAMGHLGSPILRRVLGALETWVLGSADAVVTISYKMRESIVGKGIDGSRVQVFRNWVDVYNISSTSSRKNYKELLNLSADTILIVYSGSIGGKQGLDGVLDAADDLKGDTRYHFLIVGDGPEKARLVARATQNVSFLPLQAEKDLPALLKSADLHILPQEPHAADLVLPSKLGGMLASGKPILVQAAAGTELYNFLRGAALIVQPSSPGQLSTAIASEYLDSQSAKDQRFKLAESLSKAITLPRLTKFILPEFDVDGF